MSRISATARVILGLLKFSSRTGYDVKRVTDFSTRFFWRASYGQIYPELRALEKAGLVSVREEPYGRRARHVYTLTPEGERALHEWLTGEDDVYELRDEGLLRLFFGELVSHEELLDLVRRRQRWFAEAGERFVGLASELGPIEGPSGEVLRHGIELMAWNAEWWADVEVRLQSGARGQAEA